MVVTFSNHLEILAMHEASRECVWLRSMIQHIRESCGSSFIKNNPIVLYEDSAILKVIELSIFHQSSFTLMNLKNMVKLMCNK